MAMERTERPERPMNRDRRPRRKVCAFCADKIEMIDYKDTQRLRRYLSERGKIVPHKAAPEKIWRGLFFIPGKFCLE